MLYETPFNTTEKEKHVLNYFHGNRLPEDLGIIYISGYFIEEWSKSQLKTVLDTLENKGLMKKEKYLDGFWRYRITNEGTMVLQSNIELPAF